MWDDAIALNTRTEGTIWDSESSCDRFRVRVGVGLLGVIALVTTVYGFVLLAQAFAEKDSEAKKIKFIGAGVLLSPLICSCIAAIALTKREADNPQIV